MATGNDCKETGVEKKSTGRCCNNGDPGNGEENEAVASGGCAGDGLSCRCEDSKARADSKSFSTLIPLEPVVLLVDVKRSYHSTHDPGITGSLLEGPRMATAWIRGVYEKLQQ